MIQTHQTFKSRLLIRKQQQPTCGFWGNCLYQATKQYLMKDVALQHDKGDYPENNIVLECSQPFLFEMLLCQI